MGLPNFIINFINRAITALTRSEKGIVAIILKDTAANGAHTLSNITEIPEGIGAANRDYITRAFIGNVTVPRLVLLYVLPADAADYSDALKYYETAKFDYLVGPPDITTEAATEISTWIKSERLKNHMVKAVLPNVAADHEAIVNFTSKNIKVNDKTYGTAEYCSRIAGLIAGTPIKISCTYSILPEVTDVERLPKSELDTKIDNGEFIIFHDGEKVKVGRGVNSLKTTTVDKGASYKKIKIIEALDLINIDIRMTSEDSYIGKFPNSYDNKCLLITAIKNYYTSLEDAGILDKGKSSVGIDLIAQTNYLKSKGEDTSNMSENEIKEADTDDKVFIVSSIKILDAIEDISLNINF